MLRAFRSATDGDYAILSLQDWQQPGVFSNPPTNTSLGEEVTCERIQPQAAIVQ